MEQDYPTDLRAIEQRRVEEWISSILEHRKPPTAPKMNALGHCMSKAWADPCDERARHMMLERVGQRGEAARTILGGREHQVEPRALCHRRYERCR
ncbi:MAG: hypothetical protein PVH07_09355 [Chloroflexota bacterium]|jgi:hypothetical protein